MKPLVVVAALVACGSPRATPDAAGTGPGYRHTEMLKAPIIHDQDQFGARVALSGDGWILAIGVPRDDSATTGVAGVAGDRSSPDAGAVYIYVRGAAGWEPQAYLKPAATDAADQFGASLGLSAAGDTLVVGAPGEDGGATIVDGDAADNSRAGSGAAYVFKRHGTMWEQQAYLKASNTGVADGFGEAVAIAQDGNTVIVAAPGEDSQATGIDGDQLDNILSDSGAAYVFITDGSAWHQEAYIKAAAPSKADRFGSTLAVSADGSTFVAGATGEDSAAAGIDGDATDNSLQNAGAAYVFHRANGVWSQQAYLKASNPDHSDAFGAQVAISGLGTAIVISAPLEDSSGPDQSDNTIMDSGAAYVFALDAGAWTQRAYLKAPLPNISDQFGSAVAISGDGLVIAVSAPSSDATVKDAGATFTFGRLDGTWQLEHTLQAPTPTTGDQLGTSLSLSSPGAILAVGVALDSRTAAMSGAVYLFH